MRKLPLTAAVLAVACGGASPSGFSTGPGVTSVAASTGIGSTGEGSSSTTGPAEDSTAGSGSGTSGTGFVRDVGSKDDFGPVQPPGCKGKVDLIFLISRLGTMDTEQEQLVASFPGFVETIEKQLDGFDVHIMSANPDAYWPGWTCEELCQLDPPPCDDDGYKCNDYAFLIDKCDSILGAGITFNAGAGAANRQCDLYGGNRYIISGEPNMKDAIECIAKAGWSGGDPPMGDALLAALKPKINADEGCNAGFIREDALLVVVFINDTYDTESLTWPYQQYDEILKVKKDPNAVVMLGIVPQPHEEGKPEDPTCTYDDEPEGKLRDLIDRFPYHHYGNTCAPTYAPFFDEAAALIGEACGSFVPG